MNDTADMGGAVAMFKAKAEAALKRVPDIEEFRKEDEVVDAVLKIGSNLFAMPLDKQTPDTLLRIAGRLAGAYSYLGQKSARARSERDVFEQKLSETEKELMLKYLDDDYKVTKARSQVSADVATLREFVNEKEAEKNMWENITTACDRMLSCTQSAIKVKENERFQSSRTHSNG